MNLSSTDFASRKHLKQILLVGQLFLLISCANQPTEKRYYSLHALQEEEATKLLELDHSTMNFKGITDWLSKNQTTEITTIVSFKDGALVKKIMPSVRGNGLYKSKNILSITSDSILVDKGYPISELKWILKRHYTNNGKAYQYADSPERAAIEITLDTNKTAKELKHSLILLTRVFDEVNSEEKESLLIKVIFDYNRQLPPPPPPIHIEIVPIVE